MTVQQLRCPVCKCLYTHSGGPPPKCCPACQAARDAKIRNMLEMLRDNPGMNAAQLSRATGVPIEVVVKQVAEYSHGS